MTVPRIFVENSLRQHWTWTPEGEQDRHSARRVGVATEQDDVDGAVLHRFADGDDLFTAPPVPVPGPVVDRARRLLAAAPVVPLPGTARSRLRSLAATWAVTATAAFHHQRILAGKAPEPVADLRALCTVEVRGPAGAEVVPWLPYRAEAANVAAVAAACERLQSRAELPLVDPPADAAVLFRPGRAGAFFHELVGHPMEADVLASGSSYLAAYRGRPVAPGWLSVTDGSGPLYRALRLRVDDEGTPCRRVALIRDGVVAEPMTDVATARLCGWPVTGHGRRLDYRCPAVPRMIHTQAVTRPGTAEQRPTGRWIAPHGVRLVTMNIRTGEFVFHAPAAVLGYRDRVVGRLPTLELTGAAAPVLATLRPVSRRVRAQGRAHRGCGKLGQHPLVVTFGNCGVLVPAGAIQVRAVADE